MNMKILIPVIVAVAVILVGGVFLLNQTPAPQPSPTPVPTPTPSPIPIPTPTPEIPVDWKTYRNEELEFEVRYPSNLQVAEYQDPDRRTVSFIDLDSEISESVVHIAVYKGMSEVEIRKEVDFLTKSELLQLEHINPEKISDLDGAKYWAIGGVGPDPVPVEELFFEGKKILMADLDVRLGFREGGYAGLGSRRSVLLFEATDIYIVINTPVDDVFLQELLSSFRLL
jgi:hypothetical protein